jgi:hypothetical protein
MSAFEEACSVEHESRKILEPLLELAAYNGRWVWNGKGRLARELQVSVGDVILNTDADRIISVELKAERKSSRNLFCEAWSNRSRFNPGWMWKSDADLLLYHFLSSDELYSIDFQKLKRWFHDCENHSRPPWTQWPQALQGKYEQRNDTWGVLIPLDKIAAAVGFDLLHPVAGAQATSHWPSTKTAPMRQYSLPAVDRLSHRPGPGVLREYLDGAQRKQ